MTSTKARRPDAAKQRQELAELYKTLLECNIWTGAEVKREKFLVRALARKTPFTAVQIRQIARDDAELLILVDDVGDKKY